MTQERNKYTQKFSGRTADDELSARDEKIRKATVSNPVMKIR